MAGLGDLAGLLKQAQRMQQEMARVQEELKHREVEATAGGGAVRIRINGNLDLLEVKISPDCVDKNDVAFLENLVLTACRQAIEKARELGKGELGKLTGGLSLPGF